MAWLSTAKPLKQPSPSRPLVNAWLSACRVEHRFCITRPEFVAPFGFENILSALYKAAACFIGARHTQALLDGRARKTLSMSVSLGVSRPGSSPFLNVNFTGAAAASRFGTSTGSPSSFKAPVSYSSTARGNLFFRRSVAVDGDFDGAAALVGFLVAIKCVVSSEQRRTPPRPVLSFTPWRVARLGFAGNTGLG